MNLEQRVEKLERENHRLKLAVSAVVVVLSFVALLGASISQGVPDVIEAREFRVPGATAEEEARFKVNADGLVVRHEVGWSWMDQRGVGYTDENSNVRSALTPIGFIHYDAGGSRRVLILEQGIYLSDENERDRARVQAGGIFLMEEDGDLRANMTVNGFGAMDENGEPRAILANVGATPTLSLFDAEGNLTINLGVDPKVSYLRFLDPSGTERGLLLMTEDGRASFAILDAERNVVWRR